MLFQKLILIFDNEVFQLVPILVDVGVVAADPVVSCGGGGGPHYCCFRVAAVVAAAAWKKTKTNQPTLLVIVIISHMVYLKSANFLIIIHGYDHEVMELMYIMLA